MTIIRNGENIATNWTGGSVGSGQIKSSLILSNNQEVRNLAVNPEHLNDFLSTSNLPTATTTQWVEYSQLSGYGSLGASRLLPGNSNWGSSQGYGGIKIPQPSGYSFNLIRGNMSLSGILNLSFLQNNYSIDSRFRCVKD